MAIGRSPFQGVLNVLRFNWHFYVAALIAIITLLFTTRYLSKDWIWIPLVISGFIVLTTLVSLLVTHYIYDLSELYDLTWMSDAACCNKIKVLNINAGFDETSHILETKLKGAEIHICDFYDEPLHTEVSIKRARKTYPPHPKTLKVQTHSLPYPKEEFDLVFVSFAAHEIRNSGERITFFKEITRVLNQKGQVFVTEHLRDRSNFLAYTIGFFHFYSRKTWLRVFKAAKLRLVQEKKTTPFVSTFILAPYGTAS